MLMTLSRQLEDAIPLMRLKAFSGPNVEDNNDNKRKLLKSWILRRANLKTVQEMTAALHVRM